MSAQAGVPLVAIRHAPTSWNAERRLQGRTDIGLSAAGEAAARAWRLDPAWETYRVLASPLSRALGTARLVFPEREIAIDARLAEMDFGAWEGKSLADLRGQPGGDAEARERMGLDFQAPGGESPRQVQARITPLLTEIAASDRPTIVVTHKAVLRALLSLATGWDMLEKPQVKLQPNCAHCFTVHAGGRLAVARMNYSLLPAQGVGPHPGPLPAGERGKLAASRLPQRAAPPQRTLASDQAARRLRGRMTDTEKRLWRALRGRRLVGHKFCRQLPIGDYIVDFVSRYPRLVIEVDGGQHAWREAKDEQRTAWLEAHGYTVLRFWNNEVLQNIDGVLDRIVSVLEQLQRGKASQDTTPSPQRGEGRGEGPKE